mgnify:CR=1 FL=1
MSVQLEYRILGPLIIVISSALIAMLVDVFVKRKEWVGFTAGAGIIGALLNCFLLWGNSLASTMGVVSNTGARSETVSSGVLTADNYALFLCLLFLSAGLMTVLMSLYWLREQHLHHGEYYVLLMFALSGMMLMVQSLELITIFVALETFSISLYVLSAFARDKERSSEAGLKYLLLGAFSSAFLLYGIALVYGALGTTNLTDIAAKLAQVNAAGGSGAMLPVGIGLILVGLAFKVAAVPFHLWTPDVYEGAPTPITAFMSVATKAAAFGVMARILLGVFPTNAGLWIPLVSAMAFATMIIGNLVALWQDNIKRMLAYSSIAHAGYLLIGIAARDYTGVLFYLLCYAVMNLGAFAVVAFLSGNNREFTRVDDFRGLAAKHPWAAVSMTIFMFSLTGIPPAIGYYGKFLLFGNAVRAGLTGLVIVGVLTSVVSAYYYLRVVVAMWMREEEAPVETARNAPGLVFVIALCAVLALGLGLAPQGAVGLSERASPQPARISQVGRSSDIERAEIFRARALGYVELPEVSLRLSPTPAMPPERSARPEPVPTR